MNINSWYEIAALVLGGGIGSKIIDYVVAKRKGDQSDFSLFRDTWMEEYRRINDQLSSLQADYRHIEKRYQELESETDYLREQLNRVRSVHPDLPLPMWLKDLHGIMLSLNDSYEKHFLIPQGYCREDYIGKRDEDIWPKNVAEKFKKNDNLAKKAMIQLEDETIIEDILQGWDFYKYPKFVDGILVGVAGIALPIQPETLDLS